MCVLANRSLSPHIYGKERGYTLLYTHSKFTHQRLVRMDQSVSDRNPTIPSMTVLFRPIQVMFNNVDMINVVTNSNDKERTIPLGYYTIDEIIVILSIMTDSTFSISTKVSSYGCIWIQFPHNRLILTMLRTF